MRAIQEERREREPSVESIRAQWRIQYAKVEKLCETVIAYDGTRNFYDRDRLLREAVILANELLE